MKIISVHCTFIRDLRVELLSVLIHFGPFTVKEDKKAFIL